MNIGDNIAVLWRGHVCGSPSLTLRQYNQRCRRHKFIARLIDSPRGDHWRILHPFALSVVRLCFLSEWQEGVVFLALNVFSCSSPADCYQRSVVQLLAAGVVSMGNMSEQHDLISVIFAAGLFSLLSAIWNQTCQYLATLRWKTAHTAAAFIAHKCSTISSERLFT